MNSTQVSEKGDTTQNFYWPIEVFLIVIGIFKHFSDEAINLNVMDETSQSQLA